MTATDRTGTVLAGKYSLRGVLGAGATGTVYEAGGPGGPVAVKVLTGELQALPEARRRFLEAARASQRLIHPNVVRVLFVAEDSEPVAFVVAELLSGVPLSAYTSSGVRVPVAQATAILQGMLAGLAAAHAQGIVHRALRPENVLLARETSGPAAFVPKLLDFGVADAMDAAGGVGARTPSGAQLGSTEFLSPEQIQKVTDVDARSDLWSAGVIFYEMLTGRSAFPAPTEYARARAIVERAPTPLESVDPQLARLSSFVQLALQKDRAQRFQSALEMARALGALAQSASPPSPMSRLPDVPSVLLARVTRDPGAGRGPTESGSVSVVVSSAPRTEPLPPHGAAPPPGNPATAGAPISKPGATTLASQRGNDAPPSSRQGKPLGASAGTLPSENLPMLEGPAPAPAPPQTEAGVRRPTVVALVALALVLGFVLGFVAGRLG